MASKDRGSKIINLVSDDEGENNSTPSIPKKASGFINLITDDEASEDDQQADSDNEPLSELSRSPSPPANMQNTSPSQSKEQSSKPSDTINSLNPPPPEGKGSSRLYSSTCATAGCKTSVNSRDQIAYCLRCTVTQRYEASRQVARGANTEKERSVRRPSGTAVHSPFVKNGVQKATRDKYSSTQPSSSRQTSQATSSKLPASSDLISEGSYQSHRISSAAQPKSSTGLNMEHESDDSLPELSQIRPSKRAKL